MFSSAVRIGDLNDFIAPAQACVVALGGSSAADAGAAGREQQQQQEHQTGHVQLQPRQASTAAGFKQTYSDADGGAVKVTLHDCLACSGCVTSAETVLLQHQSAEELHQQLQRPGVVVVVSVSPQSRASLAALHGMSAGEVAARLTGCLKALGAALVLDIGPARDLALAESAHEFIQRCQRSRLPSCTGAAPALPMLASACPGWVVYAEKTHGEYVLPHLSTTKSPQAVMGSLVKRRLAAARGWDPGAVYHATVMPCYDKKLEAVRDDLVVPGSQVPEVDCTLTTGELQELLEQHGFGRLREAPAAPLDTLAPHLAPPRLAPGDAAAAAAGPPAPPGRPGDGPGGSADADAAGPRLPSAGHGPAAPPQPRPQQQQQQQRPCHAEHGMPGVASCRPDDAQALLHGRPGGSGGYLQHIFRAAAQALYGVQLAEGASPLATRLVRNADFQELSLLDPRGAPLLRFAAAYGFRNIQTLMRKVKGGRCDYDYVEVMACPGGCLNGGGQLKPRPGQTAAQLLDQLEGLYYAAPGDGGRGGDGDMAGQACSQPPWQQQQQQQQRRQEAAAAVQVEPGVVMLVAAPEQHQQPQQGPQPPPADGAASDALGVAARCADDPGAPCWGPGAAAGWYDGWVGGAPGSEAAKGLLHTSYRHRQKTAAAAVSDW